MKETRFFYVPDAACQTELPEEEAQHALRVLRLKMGDELMLMDGNGTFFRAEVAQASSHRCFYQICESLPSSMEMAPASGDGPYQDDGAHRVDG